MPRTIEIEAQYGAMNARDHQNVHESEKKSAAWAQPMSTTLEIEVQCAAVCVRDENRRPMCCVVDTVRSQYSHHASGQPRLMSASIVLLTPGVALRQVATTNRLRKKSTTC
jgi:hypothetical protein